MKNQFSKNYSLRIVKSKVSIMSVLYKATLLLSLSVFIALSFLVAVGGAEETFTPGRIIVKFKAVNEEYPDYYLIQEAPLQPVTGVDSLELINQRFNVLSAKPLFRKGYVRDLRDALTVFMQEVESVRSEFPERTKRAPKGTEVSDLSNVYLLEVPEETDILAAREALSMNPFVEYAEPPHKVKLHWEPDDPYWHSSGSWGYSYPDLWGLKRIQVDSAWDITRGDNIVVAVIDSGVDYEHPDIDRDQNGWINGSERQMDEANCYDGEDNDLI